MRQNPATPTADLSDRPAGRRSGYPVAPLFLQRWSPRSFEPAAMPRRELLTILEAARWAPSAYNLQPWRFIYALRDDPHWQRFVDLLDAFNAAWARDASALVILVSERHLAGRDGAEPKPSRTHSFDAGAAWAQLALQATLLGYQAHAMAGIHFDAVRRQLGIPDAFQVEIAIAIGRRADAARLPPQLQAREIPSTRRPLDAVAFSGRYGAPGPAGAGAGA